MRSSIGVRRAPFVMAVGAVALGTAVAPAAADDREDKGRVEFAYEAPEIADGWDTVTWRWKLVNNSGAEVSKVVLVHRLTPKLAVRRLDPACRVQLAGMVRCEYARLGAGAVRTGSITAGLPTDASGSAQIQGRVTWQQAAAPAATPVRPPVQSPAA